MNAAVGSTLKVIGSRSAMVSAGPSPGSTPIAVPSVVPTRHHIRLTGVSAMAKPSRSCEKASMSRTLPDAEDALDRVLDQTGPDVDAERLRKAEIGHQCEGCSDRGIAHDRLRPEAARHADEQKDGGDRETGAADEQHIENEAGGDPQQGGTIGRGLALFLRTPAAGQRGEQQEG